MFQDGSGGTTILIVADYKAPRQHQPARYLQPGSKLPRSSCGKAETLKPATRPGSSCWPRSTTPEEVVGTESLHCRAADETKLRGPGSPNSTSKFEAPTCPPYRQSTRPDKHSVQIMKHNPEPARPPLLLVPRRSRRPTRRAIRTTIGRTHSA